MDIDWYFRLIILVGLLIFSAFFSGSEVALFSLDKNKIKDLIITHPLIGGYINDLLEYPRRLLVTILLCNTIVNVALTIIAVTLALELAAMYNFSKDIVLAVQIIITTFLVLIIGEITPKVWASKYPVTFAKVICIPLYWIREIFHPISKVLTELIKFFVSKINLEKTKIAMLTQEFTELADLSTEKGTIDEEEQELIHGLVSFRTVTVREVMTPRVDITAVPIDSEFNELMQVITDSGHSRIPIYGNNLDEIVGIIYVKDLLPYLKNNNKKNLSLVKIARKAMFVPETKLISDLLKEFQEKKMHVGIVVDEYGGTAGLVSLEDILEEIVGEIRDEYDREENQITKIDANKYLVLGKVSIDQLNDVLDTSLIPENEDYDTVGGFILNYSGTIPGEGYTFEFGNFKFTVQEVVNRRVKKVLVELLPNVDINAI